MESLFIQATEDTPLVNYNIEANVFLISGRSYPENAIDFYEPVIAWIEQLFAEIEHETYIFEFDFEYFNTASSKQIMKMLLTIEKFVANRSIIIRWFYEKEDTDMLFLGQQYPKILKLYFEIIEKEIGNEPAPDAD